MARPTLFYAMDYVAKLIDENIELLTEVARNSDNIDEGEMIHVSDGSDESIIVFTNRGIENLQDFLNDIRSQAGGIRQFSSTRNANQKLLSASGSEDEPVTLRHLLGECATADLP
jgi:superfamily I DNA/RNA helicase